MERSSGGARSASQDRSGGVMSDNKPASKAMTMGQGFTTIRVKELEDLKSQLSRSTKREERYRKALELIVMDCEMFKGMSGMEHRDMNYLSAIKQRSEAALSSSPAPEPVTVEELDAVLDRVWDAELHLAEYLLTKFKIERKG